MLKFSEWEYYIQENVVYNVIDYVTKKHGDQKYGDKPYIYHILKVKEVCDKFIDKYDWSEHDKDVIKISIMCHDLIEDTDVTYEDLEELFNSDVAKVVFNVTGIGKNRKERNINAYNKISKDDRSVFVKLCDRISNVEQSNNNLYLLNMYKKEYPDFKRHIFNNKFIEMWKYLDELMG